MTMNLEEAIDQAGSPLALLWQPNARAWSPPVIEAEYAGWQREQTAAKDSVALSDLSHHMADLFIEGPDAVKLLAEHSANNYERFEIGQAKQFIAVTPHGHMISDGILMRDAEQRITLTGPAAAQNWIRYQGTHGGYDVSFSSDPDSAHRGGLMPVLCRFQIQGPQALALAEKLFGEPLPPVRFFHSVPVTLNGRELRALRHGMSGQPGFEFIGAGGDGDYIKEALMKAGEEFGLVQVGARAYSTNGIESGWVPTQVPGIYTDANLRAYRAHLDSQSYEGMKPLNGSFFSPDIEDYYVTPYELGYGRSVNLNHDFVGRDALQLAAERPHRTKVTLKLDTADFVRALGSDPGFFVNYGRYRVEREAALVGTTCQIGSIALVGGFLSLALVEPEHAIPGTEVTIIWGEHPGPDAGPDTDLRFAEVRATVHPSPFNEYARTQYRADDQLARQPNV